MPSLQEVFDRMQEAKKKQRGLKKIYRETLQNSSAYVGVQDKLNEFKAKKKQLEDEVRASMGKEFEELESLDRSLKEDADMLSSMALTKLTKGETVQVTDAAQQQYEPEFRVKFKKIG